MYSGNEQMFTMVDAHFENITSFKTAPFVMIENYLSNLDHITVVNAHIGSSLFYFFKSSTVVLDWFNFQNISKQQIEIDQLTEFESKFLLLGSCITLKRGMFFSLGNSNFIDIYSTAMYWDTEEIVAYGGENYFIPERTGVKHITITLAHKESITTE